MPFLDAHDLSEFLSPEYKCQQCGEVTTDFAAYCNHIAHESSELKKENKQVQKTNAKPIPQLEKILENI